MTRFAVYLIPRLDGALWRFGCRALGYDSASGGDVPFHDHPFYCDNPIDKVMAWTQDPRRYGFHATLKPPFALKQGATIDELERAAAAFASSRARFVVERLQVKAIGGFLALVPATASAELHELAGDCVRQFEPYRAPLSPADHARRLARPLSDNQIAHLEQWGYPFVFDEFRFHMTLTGRLNEDIKAEAVTALTHLYEPIDGPFPVDAICICEQPDRDARFRIRRRFDFAS